MANELAVFSDLSPGIGRDFADWYWCKRRSDGDEQHVYYHGWQWVLGESLVKPENFLLEFQVGPRIPAATALQEMIEKTGDYDALQADYDRVADKLTKLVTGDITLESMEIENGCMTAEFGTRTATIMAASFNDLLKEHEAVNYLEMQFRDPEGVMVTVTIQRHGGKTPHQCRVEAEQEVARLRELLPPEST